MLTVHDCKRELKDAALKVTPARLAVLEYLENTVTPLSADRIIDHIQDEHIDVDQATIYRILEIFVKKGLLRRLEFQEGKYRYEKFGEEHHHLICESCGKIEDISDCNIADLEKEIGKKKGFLVKRHSLEFFGVCSSCQR